MHFLFSLSLSSSFPSLAPCNFLFKIAHAVGIRKMSFAFLIVSTFPAADADVNAALLLLALFNKLAMREFHMNSLRR